MQEGGWLVSVIGVFYLPTPYSLLTYSLRLLFFFSSSSSSSSSKK